MKTIVGYIVPARLYATSTKEKMEVKPPNQASLSLTKCQQNKNETYSGYFCSRATVRHFYEGENVPFSIHMWVILAVEM